MSNETTYDQHPPDRELGPTVLIVDDDAYARDRLNLALSQVANANSIQVLHATSLDVAVEVLAGTPVHVVLLDKDLGAGADQNGIEAIPEFLRIQPHLQILMVTGSKEIPDVERATRLGAWGYLTKEMPDELLITQIERAIRTSRMAINQARRERSAPVDNEELGGKSKAFREVLYQSELLAETIRPVLLLGETGTGKTELAKWIHRRRGIFLKQKERPFIAVNMATLSHELIESELFGHEKGAFTDATTVKQGLFELANNGTLFLDEIGELPLALQAKLLTVIEEGKFFRVGGSRELRANPRLIFATNRDLEAMVKAGTFREDLYMRIAMLPVRLPPLSERREDIPDIIRAILPRACRECGIQLGFEDLPQDFIEHLIEYPIEGNIRGLQHQLVRLLTLAPRDSRGQRVLMRWRQIPGLNLRKRAAPDGAPSNAPLTLREMMGRKWDLLDSDFPGLSAFLDQMKGRLIAEGLEKLGSNRKIARAFRISESTASLLIRRHTMQPDARAACPAGEVSASAEVIQ